MADPTFWDVVVEGLPTLTPGSYMSGECIDFYLKTLWMKEKNRSQMWFVSLEAIRCLSTPLGPEDGEVQHIRKQLCLPTEDAAVRPVVFVVWNADHYFVAVMDYEANIMYVFGRKITKDAEGVTEADKWDDWNGHMIWKHIPKLFGWEGCAPEPTIVYSVNWPQVLIVNWLMFPLADITCRMARTVAQQPAL